MPFRGDGITVVTTEERVRPLAEYDPDELVTLVKLDRRLRPELRRVYSMREIAHMTGVKYETILARYKRVKDKGVRLIPDFSVQEGKAQSHGFYFATVVRYWWREQRRIRREQLP